MYPLVVVVYEQLAVLDGVAFPTWNRPVDKLPLAVLKYTVLLVTRAQRLPVPPGCALCDEIKSDFATLANVPVAVFTECQFSGAV